MKVKIFTEFGNDVGLGHLIRCIVLYDEIDRRGIDVELVLYSDYKNNDIIGDRKYTLINWTNVEELKAVICNDMYCIVDSYIANEELYNTLSSYTKKICSLDDYNRINYPSGLVLNPSIYSDYNFFFNKKNIEYLNGPEYILLRSDFLTNNKKQISHNVKNILIILGGTDIRNLLPKIKDLITSNYPEFTIRIISSKQGELSSNVIYYQNISAKQVKDLIELSDFVITGAGQTLYELIYLNKPFIPIQLIDNQKMNVLGVKHFNVVNKVLYYDQKDFFDALLVEINSMISYGLRLQLSNSMENIIDGNGASRVIDCFLGE